MENKPKLIADIRCYAATGSTTYGNVKHRSFEELYNVPHKQFIAITERFACKLRELGFQLPGFDHLYIVATCAIGVGQAELSDVNPDNRIRYVDVGLCPAKWETLSLDEKHDLMVDLVEASLRIVSNGEKGELLSSVSDQLKAQRSEIEIIVKTRETQKYVARVAFKIHPNNGKSVAYLYYSSKHSGVVSRVQLCELELVDHVYKLCGSITVKNDTIVVAPRNSFTAEIVSQNYKTPFVVPISDLEQQVMG